MVQCADCDQEKGRCNYTTGVCMCFDHFSGRDCRSCVSGFSGKDCQSKIRSGWEDTVEVIKIAGVVIGSIVLSLSCIFFGWRFYLGRSSQTKLKYLPLPLEDDGTELDTNINNANSALAEDTDTLDNQLSSPKEPAPKSPLALINDDEFNPRAD